MRLHLPYLTVYRAFPGKAITIACNSFVPQGLKNCGKLVQRLFILISLVCQRFFGKTNCCKYILNKHCSTNDNSRPCDVKLFMHRIPDILIKEVVHCLSTNRKCSSRMLDRYMGKFVCNKIQRRRMSGIGAKAK